MSLPDLLAPAPPAPPAMRRAECGGVRAEIAGARVLMRRSGVLWLPDSRTLAAGDLHLEKGSAYGARGQLLPPYDTRETLARLAREVEALDPATVVLLGDTLHDAGAEDRLDLQDRAAVETLARGRTLVWVRGNHDADGPRDLPGEAVDEVEACGLTFVHEPAPVPVRGEAAGHLHPCAKLVRHRRSVRRRCFLTDGERVILPAFGAYAGGLNVLDPAFAGLFSAPPLAVALGDRAWPLSLTALSRD